DESLGKLGLDYIDLYLIHWPTPKFDMYVETYQAMEKLYKDGRVKSIGVCNFDIEHLESILTECEIKPAINQVECHPFLQQKELRAVCQQYNIQIESYSPVMHGTRVLDENTIREIAEHYGKTPAQIILRWHLQSDLVTIPNTVTPARM